MYAINFWMNTLNIKVERKITNEKQWKANYQNKRIKQNMEIYSSATKNAFNVCL